MLISLGQLFSISSESHTSECLCIMTSRKSTLSKTFSLNTLGILEKKFFLLKFKIRFHQISIKINQTLTLSCCCLRKNCFICCGVFGAISRSLRSISSLLFINNKRMHVIQKTRWYIKFSNSFLVCSPFCFSRDFVIKVKFSCF